LIAESDGREEERTLRREVARLESMPSSPRVMTALGRLHEWLDEPDFALGTYRKGLEMNLESKGSLWRTLQLESRIAACEGRTETRPSLEIEQDGRTTKVFGPACVLGRGSRSADVVVPSSTVAHQHCAIWHEDGDWYVRDLGSTNGTSLDGVELVGVAKLQSSSELQLAKKIVHVKIVDESA
jgi:hypothetical protein